MIKPRDMPAIAKSNSVTMAYKLIMLKASGVKLTYIASKSLTYDTLKNEYRHIELYANTMNEKYLCVSLANIPSIEKHICQKMTAMANSYLLT